MQQLSLYHNITVITPCKIHHLSMRNHDDYGKENCDVIRPVYLSVGNRKIGSIDLGHLSAKMFQNAVQRKLKRITQKPDLIYAHFLSNAIPVLDYAAKEKIPLVVASGESSYKNWSLTSKAVQEKMKKCVNHIICVSQENKHELVELGFQEKNITIVPNAVNFNLFKPLNKENCKQKLGIPSDIFVIGFIGHFIHRKGPNRIIEALDLIDDRDIHLICVGGQGKLKSRPFVQVIDPVPNYQLPQIYNAFDLFVLPTLHEGHCNVIEEAKACGIPIISSKGTSVEEQVDQSIGFLIDPLNISEIANAIATLKNDKSLIQEMKRNLLQRRGENSIQKRAKVINSILIKANP